jgi:hypothetical protein
MFYNATAFNQFLNNWDVSTVVDVRYVFKHAGAFDQNICWKVAAGVNKADMLESSGGGTLDVNRF